MKIVTKIYFGYATVVGLIALLGYVGFSRLQIIKKSYDDVTQINIPTVNALHQLRTAGFNAIDASNEFLAIYMVLGKQGQNHSENWIYVEAVQDIEKAHDNLISAIGTYEKLVRLYFPDEEHFINEIKPIVDEIAGINSKLIHAETNEDILRLWLDMGIYKESLGDIIDKIFKHETKELEEYTEKVNSDIRKSIILVLIITILILGTIVIFGMRISSKMSSGITMLINATVNMSKGDLTSRIDVESSDELGVLAKAINATGESLLKSTVSISYMDNIIASVADMLIVVDAENSVKKINRVTCRLLGYTDDQIIGKSIDCVLRDSDLLLLLTNQLKIGKTIYNNETNFYSIHNNAINVNLSAAPLYDSYNQYIGAVFAVHDITERKQNEIRLNYLANYDTLTGLANRTLFLDRFTQAISRVAWHNRVTAVMFCDLDRFKIINDTLGHNIGDNVLRAVAERLLSCVRTGDTVGRIGGDEFLLLLNDMANAQDVCVVAQKILSEVSKVFKIDEQEIFLTTSIGIAVYPMDGKDPNILLKRADLSMYRAKEKGRNSYQLFTPAIDVRTSDRLSLENALKNAIINKELEVFYQPLIDTKNGIIFSSEALVRWKHPKKGLLPPAQFLPVAVDTGLIVDIDDFVIKTACKQNKKWNDTGFKSLHISVNISNQRFKRSGLKELIRTSLMETGMDPSMLQLELTEDIVMQDIATSQASVEELYKMGIGLAIDDFGTGYSSLARLRQFQLQMIKIDRSFIRNIMTEPDDAIIVEAIITIANKLGLILLAEGVETQEQLNFLTKHGCNLFQGFYFSPPLTADKFELFMKNFNKEKLLKT